MNEAGECPWVLPRFRCEREGSSNSTPCNIVEAGRSVYVLFVTLHNHREFAHPAVVPDLLLSSVE